MPITSYVAITNPRRCVFDTTLCDKVCQWLATDRSISRDTPATSPYTTDLNITTEFSSKWRFICQESIAIPLTGLIMEIDMPRDGWDLVYQLTSPIYCCAYSKLEPELSLSILSTNALYGLAELRFSDLFNCLFAIKIKYIYDYTQTFSCLYGPLSICSIMYKVTSSL